MQQQHTQLRSKRYLPMLATLISASLLSACGGGGGSSDASTNSSQNANSANLVQHETLDVAVFETQTKTVNLLEAGCNDSLNATLRTKNGSSDLPDIYSLDDDNSVLTIDLSGVNIADGENEVERLILVCANHYTSEEGNLDITKQDSANDALMTVSKELADAADPEELFSGSITLSDDDMPENGVLADSYAFNIIDTNDSSSVYSGTMTTDNTDNSSVEYTLTVDLNAESIPVGRYRLETEAIDPVLGGYDNIQAAVSISHAFDVDNATEITKPTEDAKTSDSIDSTVGSFTDDDGVQGITVVLYSDSNLETEIARDPSGDFTGLDSGTTYYLTTLGEAKNAATDEYEIKQSNALSVTTSLF